MANPLEGRLRDGAGIVFGGGSVGDGGGNGKAAAVANARAGAKVAWSTSILPPQPLPGNLIAGVSACAVRLITSESIILSDCVCCCACQYGINKPSTRCGIEKIPEPEETSPCVA